MLKKLNGMSVQLRPKFRLIYNFSIGQDLGYRDMSMENNLTDN